MAVRTARGSMTDQAETASALAFDADLGAPARIGALAEKARSTYALAREALKGGRPQEAARLGRHTVEEAREAYELYRDWIGEIRDFLTAEGLAATDLAVDERRLTDLLRLEDGRPFDLDAGWRNYIARIEDFAALAEAGDAAGATVALRAAWAAWLETHDKGCDQVSGLLDVVARRLGEERIGPLWDRLMAPMYASYARYDTDLTPWPDSFRRLLVVALEALRGHLSGPAREGAIEVEDHPDRVVLRFDPCGSGGRSLRHDAVTGAGPRTEPPFGFRVTERAHDWSWGRKGICLCCVHCCQLNMRMPIARFGYPTRVVEPPTWPAARAGGTCSWTIYKDPRLVPAAAYQAVGGVKPGAIGSAATRANAASPE
jgi:hypothetical protein